MLISGNLCTDKNNSNHIPSTPNSNRLRRNSSFNGSSFNLSANSSNSSSSYELSELIEMNHLNDNNNRKKSELHRNNSSKDTTVTFINPLMKVEIPNNSLPSSGIKIIGTKVKQTKLPKRPSSIDLTLYFNPFSKNEGLIIWKNLNF
jgi:hypothetical protein